MPIAKLPLPAHLVMLCCEKDINVISTLRRRGNIVNACNQMYLAEGQMSGQVVCWVNCSSVASNGRCLPTQEPCYLNASAHKPISQQLLICLIIRFGADPDILLTVLSAYAAAALHYGQQQHPASRQGLINDAFKQLDNAIQAVHNLKADLCIVRAACQALDSPPVAIDKALTLTGALQHDPHHYPAG